MTVSITPAIQEISDILRKNYVFIDKFELTPLYGALHFSVQIFSVYQLNSGGNLVVCAARKVNDDKVIRMAVHHGAERVNHYQF